MLVIVAASHLDAVTFQICSQSFKIMPTAFFAVWLLGQYLTPLQWGSLPVLAVGVVFVTMNGSTPAGAPLHSPAHPEMLHAHSNTATSDSPQFLSVYVPMVWLSHLCC